jgi:UDP-2-acetamido-2,6-beta-L-arabino-hexul-4-ose reductase
MNILVTGSSGFMGKNLVARLNATQIGSVMPFDINDTEQTLAEYISKADVVFHLAGVNRPKEASEFHVGNTALTETLVRLMVEQNSKAPIIFTSSSQVSNGSEYAVSKEKAENTLLEFSEKTGNEVFIFRFPGTFGKWSRPNYNTVVATFCYNISRGLNIEMRNPSHELQLCYIDDVVDMLISTAIERKQAEMEPIYKITLGELAEKIKHFAAVEHKLEVSDMSDELTKKLYATYLSFLPEDSLSYDLLTHKDDRGSFTEFLHLPYHGQVSINVTKPGITKGEHWHDTKSEKFLVVTGCATTRLRKIGTTEIIERDVSSDKMEVLNIPPGYTHNFTNTGDVDLVTMIWVNEVFDKNRPDTYFEKVEL